VWLLAAFLVAAALAVAVRLIFGSGSAVLALRITARWSFLLFWLAYVGGPIAKLWGLGGLARRGRELGLAFASAQLVHVAIILWSGDGGGMSFFWVGILFTYLLAFFSMPRLHKSLGPRLWRILLPVALNYIALVFAVDFILGPLQMVGVGHYPLSYIPFALMLFAGVALRVAALIKKSAGAPATKGRALLGIIALSLAVLAPNKSSAQILRMATCDSSIVSADPSLQTRTEISHWADAARREV